MIITANHNDLMVSLELATMRVGIHRNNVWLGSGKWSLRAGIVDCAAHLDERVYDALDDAMRDAIDAYVEDRVDDLRAEALTHNDVLMVELCDDAKRGSATASAACFKALCAAAWMAAQDDD
jgi:hypothetical protein